MHAYRDPRTALLEKKAAVARELEHVDAELSRLQRAVDREGGSLLDRVYIASKCSANWADMPGNARQRSCAHCQKDVYNISAMTRAEAEAFLEARIGLETCLKLYRREDGTILTTDCPAKKKKRVYLMLAGVAAVAVLYVPLSSTESQGPGGDTGAQRVTAPIGAAVGTTTEAR